MFYGKRRIEWKRERINRMPFRLIAIKFILDNQTFRLIDWRIRKCCWFNPRTNSQNVLAVDDIFVVAVSCLKYANCHYALIPQMNSRFFSLLFCYVSLLLLKASIFLALKLPAKLCVCTFARHFLLLCKSKNAFYIEFVYI